MEPLIVIGREALQTLIIDSVNACLKYVPNNPATATEKPVTRKELCAWLGVTEPTVIRWEKRGKIPVMRIGSAVRYDRAAVIKALEKKGGKP